MVVLYDRIIRARVFCFRSAPTATFAHAILTNLELPAAIPRRRNAAGFIRYYPASLQRARAAPQPRNRRHVGILTKKGTGSRCQSHFAVALRLLNPKVLFLWKSRTSLPT
jgi:hypothetical protein